MDELQDGRQEPVQEENSASLAPRSATDSADNPRLPQDAGLIRRLRADLVKAERRAERAEAMLKKTKRKRPKRICETPEFAAGVERYLRAWGVRVAEGDPSDLKRLHEFRKLHAVALRVGVQGQHANGTSWTVIGDVLGITRQGARQQWGRPDVGTAELGENDAARALR